MEGIPWRFVWRLLWIQWEFLGDFGAMLGFQENLGFGVVLGDLGTQKAFAQIARVEFNGGSRQDRNCRNRQNHRDRHRCLLALYLEAQAKGGQGVLQNRQHRQNRKTVMKATLP